MGRVLFFFVFVTMMLLLPSLMKRLTYGFKVAKIQYDFPYVSEWNSELPADLSPVFQQTFRFLGKGAQSYVFESRDEQYVIKLFRYDHHNSLEEFYRFFTACKIAYDILREETGLIYIHLNITEKILPTIQCIDALGRKYSFPLDNYRFAIQKKATSFREAFSKAEPQIFQKRIDQFLDLLDLRTEKDVVNTDSNLNRNFGFLEDRAIEFDFGNYEKRPNLNHNEEKKRYTSQFRKWLLQQAPDWIPYLDEQVEKRR